jgi:GT2 family glycosyltransferase
VRVTAGIVTWNSGPALDGALASLAAQTHPDLEVVVIDNASTDDSPERARAHGVRVVINPTNRGFAAAANQLVEQAWAAGSGALLLCNPDVRLEPDYVARAVAALSADPARAAVQGRLWRFTPGEPAPPAHQRWIDTTGHVAFRTRLFRNRGEGQLDDGRYASGEIFGVSGAVALYRLSALTDVAVDGEAFDGELFAYWEDVDLDWRLQLRGWRAWYAADARGWHERGGAGPRRSQLVERLNFVNRFAVIIKNDDPAAFARASPGVALTTLLKTAELAVTVPGAFLRALPALWRLRSALAQRRVIQGRATVDPAVVIDRWFVPFDYGHWIRTYLRRVRRERATRVRA